MTRRKRSTTIVKAFVSRSLIFALSAGAVHAADLPSPPAAPHGPAPEAAPRWYVRLGAGRTQSKLVQPLRATHSGGRRPGNWSKYPPAKPGALGFEPLKAA